MSRQVSFKRVLKRVTPQQGVPGDAVPWPEREVSSLPSLFPRPPPQAAQDQQGVPGDAVPWPEREVSSLPPLFPRLPPQAAQVRYLSSS